MNILCTQNTYRHLLLGQECILLGKQDLCLGGITHEQLQAKYKQIISLV